jgi:hypothetical protein
MLGPDVAFYRTMFEVQTAKYINQCDIKTKQTKQAVLSNAAVSISHQDVLLRTNICSLNYPQKVFCFQSIYFIYLTNFGLEPNLCQHYL